MLSRLRLLRYRLRHGQGPVLLRDRRSLNLLCALAALVVMGALFSLVSSGEKPTPQVDSAEQAVLAQAEKAPAPIPPEPGQEVWPPFFEGEATALVKAARQADVALFQALIRRGISPSSLVLVDSEIRRAPDGGDYPFLRLIVSPNRFEEEDGSEADQRRANAFASSLREALRIWAPKARLSQEGEGLYFVLTDNLVTHSIRYGQPKAGRSWALPEQQQASDKAVLTIIIDDMGENMATARRLTALPYPVTFSIWPHSAYAAFCATLAEEKGRQVIIHQPLEPYNQKRVATAPGTLQVGSPRADLRRALYGNLGLVPYAVGLNNHQGSRFTSDEAAIRVFCEELFRLRPDFLVLDSLTHEASLFYEQARHLGFTALKRDIFLDDPSGGVRKEDVLKALDRGLALARKNGRAIVIGHPKAGTLAALESWRGYKAQDVVILPLAAPARLENETK